MLFPSPPAPAFVPDQAATTESYLRYEDVAQDGRLLAIAIPPALGGLWRGVLLRHRGARNAVASGVVPILTRLTVASHDRPIRVDRPIEARSGFELARSPDGRLFMNVWSEVHGTGGRIVPREPAGPLVLAGQLFAEHIYTRPFAPKDQRRVTRFDIDGYPAIPDAEYAAPEPTSAGDAPDGATWIDELADDPAEVVFTLDQTDSNQHVNSLVYIRMFLDAAQRRLAATGRALSVRTSAVDIAYRKPCFAGDRVRVRLRLYDRAGSLGAAGVIVPAGAATDDKPRCFVRCQFGQ